MIIYLVLGFVFWERGGFVKYFYKIIGGDQSIV